MDKEMDTLEEETQISEEEEEHDQTIEMSDEEFEKYLSGLPDTTEPETTEEVEESSPSESDTAEAETTDEEEDTDSDTTEEKPDDEESESKEDSTEESDDTEEDDTETSDEEANVIDYKKAYEQVMSPFKANGKEITPESLEDVITLMQMGANYTKKMAALKPNLKIVKTLEQAGIDGEQLNFLIDLHKKDPDAVKKILVESDVDPMDVDKETPIDYTPKDHGVSDEEVAFDEIVNELSTTEAFNTTRVIVTEAWDDESKRTIAKNPQLLKKLNEEVEMGRYEKVQAVIDRERIMGRLEGVSDLTAYIDIVTAMAEKETEQLETKSTQTPPKRKVDPSVTADKKKAAKTNRSTKGTSKTTYTDEELMAMDDEQFQKVYDKGLY